MVDLIVWLSLVKWMEGEALLFDHRWESFLVVFLVIILVLIFLLYAASKYYDGLVLKMKLEPHTMRNMYEELRIKIKRLNRKAKGVKADPKLIDEVVDQVEKLYEQVNRDSDFLAYIAETDELKQDVVPISKELEFVGKLVERYGKEGSRCKIENGLNDNIMVPSMITQSMVENAFKYGDKTAPEFMTVTFEGPDVNKKYTILVKNKVNESFDEEVYSTKQGVKNLVERIDNYNFANEDNYLATPKRACKNGYYYFKIDFSPNKK